MEKEKEVRIKKESELQIVSDFDRGVKEGYSRAIQIVINHSERLLEADRIVRRLAESENMSERLQLSIVAQHYVKANPNKEGGEGE